MHDPLEEPLKGVSIYNPKLLSRDELIHDFVARIPLHDRLLEDLRREAPGQAPQHHLLVGQRGMGKTTLLRRLCFSIEDDPELAERWLPLTFPEEQYNVSRLSDLWLNCLDSLGDTLEANGRPEAAHALDQAVEALLRLPEDTLATRSLELLLTWAQNEKRGLVLLLDNFHLILERLSADQWALRELLSEEPNILIIGSSIFQTEATRKYDAPFYDFFQIHQLGGLSDEEMMACLKRLAERSRNPYVIKLLETSPERIRPIYTLSGGNPRTLVLLYSVLAQGEQGDVRTYLESLLDQATPLYKARLEALAPKAQQVVDAMAIHWHPINAGDLAARLRMDNRVVSSQIDRLMKLGIVERVRAFDLETRKRLKKSGYQLSERFFNIWYLMRASRRMRRRLIWLVEFLRLVSAPEELRHRATQQLKTPFRRDRLSRLRRAEYSLALAQTVEDRRLRRTLEHDAVMALAEDRPLRRRMKELLDPAEEPELLELAERVQRLKEIHQKVVAAPISWNATTAEEFGATLCGHPGKTLEEKEQIASELDKLTPEALSELTAELSQAKAALSGLVTAPVAEQAFRAVGEGFMVNLEDLEGACAAASAYGNPELELIARLVNLPKAATFLELSVELDQCLKADPEFILRLIKNLCAFLVEGYNGPSKEDAAQIDSVATVCLQLARAGVLLLRSDFAGAAREFDINDVDEQFLEFARRVLRVFFRTDQAFGTNDVDGNLFDIVRQVSQGVFEFSAEVASQLSDVDFEEGLSHEPETSVQWCGRGIVLLARGDFRGARKAIHQAMARDPEAERLFRAVWERLGFEGDPFSTMGALTGTRRRLLAYLQMFVAAILMTIGREREALAIIRSVSYTFPDDRILLERLANVLDGWGKWEESALVYRRLTELAPDSASVWNALGDVLFLQDKDEEAEQAYQKVVELKPDSASAWVDLGSSQFMQDQLEEAEASYRHAIVLDQDSVKAWKGLGDVLQGRERYKESVDSYRRALAIAPKDVFVWTSLSRSLIRLDELDEAEKAARQAVQLAPTRSVPLVALTDVQIAQGRLAEAESTIRKATALEAEDAFAWLSLSEVLEQLDRAPEAVAPLLKALELEPEDAFFWTAYGELRNELEHYSEAKKAFQKAVQLEPSDIDGWIGLVGALFRLDELSEAEQAVREAIKVAREDGDVSGSWYVLSRLLDRDGRPVEAREALNKALERVPDDAESWTMLGEQLEDDGLDVDAEAAYRRAMALDDKNTRSRLALALLFDRTGRARDAEKLLRQALVLDPRDAEVAKELARLIHSHSLDLVEAEQLAQKAVTYDPDDLDATLLLATIFVRQDAWEDASYHARRFLKKCTPGELEAAWPNVLQFFTFAVQKRHADDARKLLESVGLRERWVPLREALLAAHLRSRETLAAVAPEIRKPAEMLFDGFFADSETRVRQ